MQLVDKYIEYFRTICENHPELNHAEGDGTQVFSILPLLDYVGGQWRGRLREKGYAFILLLFNETMGSNSHLVRNGGFVVLHYHSSREGEDTDFTTALQRSQKVGYDVIQRMMYDSRNDELLFGDSITSTDDIELAVEPEVFSGDAGYSGYMFAFRFKEYFDNCIENSGVAWKDLSTVMGDPDQSNIIGDDSDNIIGSE